jgi:hypothetical protein
MNTRTKRQKQGQEKRKETLMTKRHVDLLIARDEAQRLLNEHEAKMFGSKKEEPDYDHDPVLASTIEQSAKHNALLGSISAGVGATSVQGIKHDDDKVRYDLMPVEAEHAVARVLTHGAHKYSDRNWENGIRYGRCYAAARRHMADWWQGKLYDDATGEHILAHAVCEVMFLITYDLRNNQSGQYVGWRDKPDHVPPLNQHVHWATATPKSAEYRQK